MDALFPIIKLEVSGKDEGPLGTRVKGKRRQVKDGLAAVVGFERRLVRIERVGECEV